MIDDPLKGLTKRQMEDLKERLERELQVCIACGNVGAVPARISLRFPGAKGSSNASIKICMACFEKNRLPDARATE